MLRPTCRDDKQLPRPSLSVTVCRIGSIARLTEEAVNLGAGRLIKRAMISA